MVDRPAKRVCYVVDVDRTYSDVSELVKIRNTSFRYIPRIIF